MSFVWCGFTWAVTTSFAVMVSHDGMLSIRRDILRIDRREKDKSKWTGEE
jgi:hypothetical protein